MRDYYLENSYGAFEITGEVIGPLMMPQTYAYYVGSNHGISMAEPNSQTLAHDAVVAANPHIDFSQYDVDDNGAVDGVMVVFAGYGFEEAMDDESQTIQSHQWLLSASTVVILDGVMVLDYTVQPEEHGPIVGSGVNGIGVYCHEWGHILGAIDLYDEDFSSWGVGNWSIMGNGNYLDNSNTPSHFDPWTKSRLGWVNVVNVSSNVVDQVIPSYAESPAVFRLWMWGMTGNEYFLVCNRQKTGFDRELPDKGLLILHCDDGKADNSQEYIPGQGPLSNHYKVAVEQADGKYDLEKYEGGNPGDNGDLYDDRSREFDDLTYPSSRGYSSISTQVAVWNISPSGFTMTANLDVTYSRPLLVFAGHAFNDDSGDGDDVPDPGETVQMMITTQNLWKLTTNVEVTVSCSEPAVTFARNSFTISQLGTKDYYQNNDGNEILFAVPAGMQPTIADFYINYSCEGGAFTFADTLTVDLGPKQVLIVDDDANYFKGIDYSHYYVDALTALRIPHEVYDKDLSGSPSSANLAGYPMVCWYTGDHRPDSLLVHDDIAALQSYLDSGGKLLLTGQDIAEKLTANSDSTFLIEYLGVRYIPGMPQIIADGIVDDPISDGHRLALGGSGGAANQQSPDILGLVNGLAEPVYTYFQSTALAGVHVDAGDYRAVYLGFGVEAIADGLSGFTKRKDFLGRAVYWLIGLSTGILEEEEITEDEGVDNAVPGRFALSPNYPNPFNGRTTIEYTVMGGEEAEISLEIIDILGRKVTTLFTGTAAPGVYRMEWDGRNNSGMDVASGVYFYRLVDRGGVMVSRRLVYLK